MFFPSLSLILSSISVHIYLIFRQSRFRRTKSNFEIVNRIFGGYLSDRNFSDMQIRYINRNVGIHSKERDEIFKYNCVSRVNKARDRELERYSYGRE